MGKSRRCPVCGHRMVPEVGCTSKGAAWTAWACRHCMHRETTRECPQCHEEHVPVASAKGPVCPSCGHRYNG